MASPRPPLMLVLLLSLAAVLAPRPARAQTDEQFRKVYDEFSAAMKAGSLPRLLAVLTPARAKVVKKECADPAEKAAGFAMGASMQPTSYEIVGRTPCKGGKKVIIYLIGTFEVPPDVAKARDIPEKSRNEISVDFHRVGKVWKMDTPSYGGDPDKVKRPKDLKRGDLSKYKDDAETSLGGRVLRVETTDETVAVILRVLDEENVVFLPPAAEALAAGFHLADYTPGQIVEFSARPHKKDKLKYLALTGQVIEIE